MAATPALSSSSRSVRWSGFQRRARGEEFLTKLGLQFVQCLGNPWYMHHLAGQKLLEKAEFIAYLHYLQYFSQPKYIKYLTYPGPTLQALRLLQQEKFRQDILMPETVVRLIEEGVKASTQERPN